MRKKKLILVSLDALSCTDFAYIQRLPNFAKLIAEGAYCPNETSVYPSLTFPCHASIATGCVPNSHGIVSNYLFNPFSRLPKWNFYASNLRRKAIWDYAAENGKKVLNMSWPVSAGAAAAYSMPEMSPAKPKEWNMDSFFRQLLVFLRYGTPSFAIKTLLSDKRLPQAWFLGRQPVLDECMMRSFLNAIRRCDFDIGMMHIYGLDDARHTYGNDAEACQEYLRKYDRFIGKLLAYSQERPKENITLMITGDHAQKDVAYAIYGNMLLEQHGLCRYEGGLLKSYLAYLDGCDGMAYLYLRENCPDQETVLEQLRNIFGKCRGVKKIMTGQEASLIGSDVRAALVLEADDGYAFESGYEPEAAKTADKIIRSHYRALHGYLPGAPDYQTMFFCYGKDVNAVRIPEMCITDILPSICHWMGFSIEQTDGIARTEIWKTNG